MEKREEKNVKIAGFTMFSKNNTDYLRLLQPYQNALSIVSR